MKLLKLRTYLTSNFHYSDQEYDQRSKTMALNAMLLVIAVLLFVMTGVRFYQGALQQGAVNFIFTVLSIATFFWMRGDKKRTKIAAQFTCFSGFVIVSSVFFNITEDTIRIAWFLVLLPPVFFLCGARFGTLIAALSLTFVSTVHYFGKSGYRDYDIIYFSALNITVTIFLIFYEYKVRKNSELLQSFNTRLEGLVKDRTIELQNESKKLLVTLRSIGEGVITTDTNGNIVLINKVTEQLTGWTQKEVAGLPVTYLFDIIHTKTGEACDNGVKKVLSSGKIIAFEDYKTLIARNGSQYDIKSSVAPIFDLEEKVIGTILVFRNATEEKRTEIELLKVKKLESVGVLAGGIAHDFNNILAGILGNIELAEIYTTHDHKAFPLLEEAKKASIRAKKLTQQLLTFSKGGDPVKQTASIETIITDSANFVLHGSSVVCNHNIPEDLWVVDVDAGQISQVIQNIILNSRHAMPNGGIIKVCCENISSGAKEISLLPNGNYIKLTINDAGTGIPEKYLDKVFDPYFSTKQEGSGLGLAISHSIISKHNGSISVQSVQNKGTTFTIYLPASLKNMIDNEPLIVQETNIPAQKALVLLMDDEYIVQKMVKHMLEYCGHEVLLTANGQEAIRCYKDHLMAERTIDIVMLDLTIPGGMGGKDTVREILKLNPTAKVIAASGYSNDPTIAHYSEYGFIDALAKPFQLAELNDTINRALNGKQ